ncbi:ATP-binding protein [Arthrobacter sp. TMN-37]
MTEPDLLRPSRDGDQFHYTWAARQSLRLLDKSSGLHSLFVEAVDPSEQPTLPISDTVTADSLTAEDDTGTGDEVIDLAEYWGASDIAQTDRVVYRQFKHSTRYGDTPWTLSFLTKTLIGFARKYRALKANHLAVLERVQFEFVSNRPPAPSAMKALEDLRTGVPSSATRTIRECLMSIITADDIAALCQRLVVDERAPSLLKLRHLLDLEVADLLPGAPGEQALLLREMISSRATSIAGNNPAVRRTDVLASLKTSEDQLLPSPNLIEPPRRPIDRRQFAEIATKIMEHSTAPTLVHGPGGVGKSVLAGALGRHLPEGSITIVFDCFGNGSYRRPSAPRHRPKQGFVQLVNELAGRALCDPLIPSATADDADYALAFLRKLTKAAETVATTEPVALLTIVIDAADNSAMISDEMGERSFVRGLLREPLPDNVRLVVTCRTERIDLLGLPADYQDIPLHGFDLGETFSHLQTTYPDVSAADASEFHSRTSHNPRVQAAVLDAAKDLHEALAWLAPNPSSPGQALDSLIERQVAEIRDGAHGSGPDIDAICVGLAALRPMIPVRVLADLADIHPSVVLSFIADLGRPLLLDGDTVQFRDEPTETWFRNRYRPAGKSLDAFIERLSPLADQDAYVAASLPALLFEANRFDGLVQLALSDDRLPDNALPGPQRNEIQRREIAQQRTHFALTAALRANRDFEAAQLALRLGALTAGRTRRLDLIRENTDLAAQFLDPTVLEQLIATRSLTAGWPNSNLPIEGALLAGAAGQTDQARNRLRSARSWMHAWVRQAQRGDTKSGVEDLDVLQVSWGVLNTDGSAACVQFLRSWRPRTLAFDVGVDIARRLLDAGRLADLADLARAARGRHLKLAIAHACAERDVEMDTEIVAHLLQPIMKRKSTSQLSRHADYERSGSGDPLHNGLTAAIWLTSRGVAHKILAPLDAAQILRAYLPENLGHLTGSWYDPDIWYPILGLVLCARLEGRAIDPVDIQGPSIREAREREKFESSQNLRTYRANVEPLVSWAVAWLDFVLDQTSESSVAFGRRISAFLQEAPLGWRQERIDQTKVNTVVLLIGRALARLPEIVDQVALLTFQAGNNDVITRRTLINLIRQTATHVANHELSSELAKRCHEYAANAREDAGELASDFVKLARATYRISPEEAIVHFQAAIDITDAIGDDAWARWETFLAIAGHAGHGALDQPGRAYRLCQIAESLEPYLGDYLSHTDVLSVAARLSLPEALAAGSRWRDRRISPIRSLADAIATNPALLLKDDPVAALALLPFGDRYPDHPALASALAAGSHDATSAIVAYLRFRRQQQLTASALDELLDQSGVQRTAIEQVDPSLLWTSTTAPADYFTSNDNPSQSPQDLFTDLDLQSASGWADALERYGRGHFRKDIFDYVADVAGPTPSLLRAFKACPTTSHWDLSRLLESLQGRSLSMATQAALDEVLSTQLARFAPDILLVSWRTLHFEDARALTGRNTDYEHITSRALAEQQSFSADQAYALATHLGRRLTVDKALQLFDAASSYFDDTAPLDAHDGHHLLGTTGSWDSEAAVAAVIWTALGDPAGKTRWQAAHSVRLALTLGHSGVVSRLLDLASGLADPTPFLDGRLEFYERHAHQWLLFAISRATVEPAGLATAALCEDLLIRTVTGTPHAVNTPLARDSLLRLHAAGLITLDSAEQKLVEQAGRPIGIKRHDWQANLEEVTSQNEIVSHIATGALSSQESAQSKTTDDDPDDDRFRFFLDFRSYWCNPLGDAFGISEKSIERLVAEVLVKHWAVPSRGRAEDDNRHALNLYPRSTYPHKSDWPEEEDLDFYLAVQGLCEVAGILLQHRPVVQRYDEDEETGNSEYTRFLQPHMPSRDDGRWLSDRRDPAPEYARLDSQSPSDVGTGTRDPHWIHQITSPRFSQELFPSPEEVAVWGFRTVQYYSQSETVSIHSALVTPDTAPALLKALQTSPDKHAYRIPDAVDEEFSSTIPGFELTGWIEPHGQAHGRDRQDPYAKSIDFPPNRPTVAMPPLKALVADADFRLWRDGENVVIKQTTWDDFANERQTTGSSGDAIVANRSWLTGVLDELDRWLIVEVEIKRRSEDSAFRGSKSTDDEDQFRFLPPYTKYFLIDNTGEVHEF